MSSDTLYGDTNDGIELRRHDGESQLDELLVYVGGRCVLHVEQMSDQSYWLGIEAGGYECHTHIAAKNGRSHVAMTADVWEESHEH